MAIRKQREHPSDETLAGVRDIVAFRARHSPPKPADVAVETDPLGSLFYSQLMSFIESRELAVLYHRGGGLLSKHDRLHYRVTEHRVVRLEFVDRLTIDAIDGPHELVSIGRYSSGPWEDRLREAHEQCLRLSDQMEHTASVEELLSNSQDPLDVVALLDSAPDREGLLKMLCLSQKRSANAYTLYMSHILTDRIAEAYAIIQTAIELNPNDARLHLSLGNFYWAALSNARGWAEGRDPGPLRQVTLDVLDMPYEKARSLARTHYLEAMRLSTRREIEEEAGAQLSTLRS
jgi:tetratricopeptide (TPR) repeat protein